MTKNINIPLLSNSGEVLNTIEYNVDFIGQIGSKAGKPYAKQDSDNDYYVMLSPITDLRYILQANSIRETWDINKPNILKPILEQIAKHYNTPTDFVEADVKVDTINHLFKQLYKQGLEPYDKLFTDNIYHIADRYKQLRESVAINNPFLNTKTFEKTIIGHCNSYYKKDRFDKLLYTVLKYKELVEEYNNTGMYNHKIHLSNKSLEFYLKYKNNRFDKKDLPKFTRHHLPDIERINTLLKTYYKGL